MAEIWQEVGWFTVLYTPWERWAVLMRKEQIADLTETTAEYARVMILDSGGMQLEQLPDSAGFLRMDTIYKMPL